eukprot:gene13648-955_t
MGLREATPPYRTVNRSCDAITISRQMEDRLPRCWEQADDDDAASPHKLLDYPSNERPEDYCAKHLRQPGRP